MMENTRESFASRGRTYTLGGIIVLLLIALGVRLVELQFMQYEQFRSQAERNSIRRLDREPARGLIYDRHGNILVGNKPAFTLTITPYEFDFSNMERVCRLFDVDSNLIKSRIARYGIASFEPIKIKHDIPFERVSVLEENRKSLPGVSYTIETRREYRMKPRMAHLLGYIKEISQKKLDELGGYYRPGDIVGYNGIEAYHEEKLRGDKGFGFFTVDSRGNVVESFENGQEDIPANEGSDIVLTLDIELQEFTERLLRNRRGAIVALDPTNGEVLAMVSAPDYEITSLSGRIPYDVWHKLSTDPAYPLYNRAIMAAYPPGSTFKMMLAAAALEEGIIDEKSSINCPGSYTLAGVTFKCHGSHGNVSVRRAIEQSCNVFFYKLVFKLNFERWSRYGSYFHFGRLTGIDIANENPGVLPSEDYYNKRYGDKWNIGYLVNLGIGQGEVNTTPLQIAAYTATIANGGTYYQPHVVRSTINRNEKEPVDLPVDSERLPISSRVWKIVQEGMYRVVNSGGTGGGAWLSGIRVAGKTGTAQNPHGRDHAWFCGYAPYDDPKIAVAVIVENAGAGGTMAAPLAGSVINYYLRRGWYPQRDTTTTIQASTASHAE